MKWNFVVKMTQDYCQSSSKCKKKSKMLAFTKVESFQTSKNTLLSSPQPEGKATQCPRGMRDKQNMVHTCNGTLLSIKKERNPDKCYNVDKP